MCTFSSLGAGAAALGGLGAGAAAGCRCCVRLGAWVLVPLQGVCAWEHGCWSGAREGAAATCLLPCSL